MEKWCFLLNPSTREYRIFPFGHDLNIGPRFSYGLGFDHVNHDYTVVQFVRDENCIFHSKCNATNLTLQDVSSTLTIVVYDVDCSLADVDETGVYVDGCLHWVGFLALI